MAFPEMRLVGAAGGAVSIRCKRKGCQTHEPEIPLPFDATPMIVERIWMQHRLEHANREK